VIRNVKFEEDFASRKSDEPILVIEDEEMEASKVDTVMFSFSLTVVNGITWIFSVGSAEV
jgi:hypothetical protein